jgi:hypothetical protein
VETPNEVPMAAPKPVDVAGFQNELVAMLTRYLTG